MKALEAPLLHFFFGKGAGAGFHNLFYFLPVPEVNAGFRLHKRYD